MEELKSKSKETELHCGWLN